MVTRNYAKRQKSLSTNKFAALAMNDDDDVQDICVTDFLPTCKPVGSYAVEVGQQDSYKLDSHEWDR